jgi:tRNA dimethylallyltransferase
MASSSRPPRSVLAIFGPTASGKTALAGVLRERLGATVVSADSAALYRDVPVITAAPGYPAELVGVVALEDDVSVGWYQGEAQAAIDAADTPIVVGGTGLYFRAALSALELPPALPERRDYWRGEVDRLGPEAAHALLAERDPGAAARVHPNDRKRVVRALELAEAGYSLAPEHDRLWTEDTRLPTTIVALDVPLEELDRRIGERTHAMVRDGAVEEARAAWSRPLSKTARKILGLEGLARYQRKWLRRVPNVVTLDGTRPPGELADAVIALGRTGQRLSRR